MSIILFKSGTELVAVDTDQVATDTYTGDDATAYRAEDVAKAVARYSYTQNSEEPWFVSSSTTPVLYGLTSTANGDIYGYSGVSAGTDPETGISYPADYYLVKLSPVNTEPTQDGSGVPIYEYTLDPVRLEDGSFARALTTTNENALGTVNIEGKEYLTIPNSNGSYTAESGNLLYDPETGKSTQIKLDTDGDGLSNSDFDGYGNNTADGPAANIPTTGPNGNDEFELIQDSETGNYYALRLSNNSGNTVSYIDRYDVTFAPDPNDPAAPPVMTIDTSSRLNIVYVDKPYYGFSIGPDGQLTMYPGSTGGDNTPVFSVNGLTQNGASYASFTDFATGAAGAADRISITPTRYAYVQDSIRMADFTNGGPHDTAYSGYLNGSAGDLNAIPLVPCFASGTLIRTINGDQPIETLKAGDLIKIADGDYAPIRWIGQRSLSAEQLAANPHLHPICIKAGALGNNLPARDLIVSPQHRMLLCSQIVRRMFAVDEVFVAAKHLTDLPGISLAENIEGVTYIHLLMDRHEIIYAEGAATESMLLGNEVLKNFDAEALKEIHEIFPELCVDGSAGDSIPARKIIGKRHGHKLVGRSVSNMMSLNNAMSAAITALQDNIAARQPINPV